MNKNENDNITNNILLNQYSSLYRIKRKVNLRKFINENRRYNDVKQNSPTISPVILDSIDKKKFKIDTINELSISNFE